MRCVCVLLCSGDYLNHFYEFVGVSSCEDVYTLYILIWILSGLNLAAFFAGILTTAVLGSLKDPVRHNKHTHTHRGLKFSLECDDDVVGTTGVCSVFSVEPDDLETTCVMICYFIVNVSAVHNVG